MLAFLGIRHTAYVTAASYEAVNDTTGEVEAATDYDTIQAVWQDGMWLVDRSWMISESDYQNGVFGNQ